MGDQGFGLHPPTVQRIAQEVKSVHDHGRRDLHGYRRRQYLPRPQRIGAGDGADNGRLYGNAGDGHERALGMQSALEEVGVFTRVISAIRMDEVCEPYIRRRAVRHLEKKRVCIFAAGTGNPYFTTDTAATLRANEMACEAIFMGKNGVDGVYDKDPKTHPDAVRYKTVSAMTMSWPNGCGSWMPRPLHLARDNNLPLIVFGLDEPGGFRGILAGEGTYTKVQG